MAGGGGDSASLYPWSNWGTGADDIRRALPPQITVKPAGSTLLDAGGGAVPHTGGAALPMSRRGRWDDGVIARYTRVALRTPCLP